MQIDLLDQSPVSLAEASHLLPGRPHLSTLHRWRLRGVRGVKLETFLIGGRRFTSREALERFIERTTAAAHGAPTPQRTRRQREVDIRRADAELKVDGI